MEPPLPQQPVVRFSPTAWAKLLFFRDKEFTEIGGFAITSPDDLLYVQDFVTVKQSVTAASVSFDDESVAEFFETQVDQDRRPEEFARIWLHTHPGNSERPSGTDEDTFVRVFDRCDWAVMFILSRSGSPYARLRFNVGPGGETHIPVQVDYTTGFEGSNHQAWEEEYEANVRAAIPVRGTQWIDDMKDWDLDDFGLCLPEDLKAQLEEMDADERKAALCELMGGVDCGSPHADELFEREVFG